MSNDQQGTPRPDDETQPVRPDGAAPLPQPPGTPTAPTSSEAYEPTPVPRRGLRERIGTLRRSEGGERSYGLAALIASALAGIIVGGLGLAAVHAIEDDGGRDRGGWMQQRDADDRGPGRGGMPGGTPGGIQGGIQGGPPRMPGQVPPTTPTTPTTPPDDESGTTS